MTYESRRIADDYCDECNGPILGRSRLYLCISWVAYWLFFYSPNWLSFSRLGFTLLSRASNIAFACHCLDKNRAVRAVLQEGETP